MTCPVCGAPAAATDAFCTNCGLALAAPPGPPQRPPALATPARACPHCGAPASASARACALCGHALQRAPTTIVRPLHAGRLLGRRYAVERMLSKGGMGAIYLATDRQGGGQVVIKTLVDYFDTSDERQASAAHERLTQEAATLARLDHPCIPRTLGSFTDAAQVFLVMEHIPGADLDRGLSRAAADGARVAGRPCAPGEVLRWGVALCRVLEHLGAQPQPVIHHDIKPANLLVDRAGDTLYLVDFGTAQARLDPAGAVGLDQSSLYGTVGYAPPEQYRGRSEPRSDVYALAATLYHLASDDDPADHPFSFPRLDALGALGEALRDALDTDVQRRPHASALRERLEGLLPAYGVALLRAPDGAWLADEDALAAWCLRNWNQATRWLGGGLPDQIARWWGDATLAAQLRAVARAAPEADTALDRALALLDPAGIGREQPLLVCDSAAVDFGQLPNSTLRRDITLENVGRRHVVLWVFLPRWVAGKSGLLALPPGRKTVLSLAPDLGRVYLGGQLRGEVLVRDHYGRRANDLPLLRVPLRATVPRRYILRRYGLPLGGAGLALVVGLGAGVRLPAPPSPALPAVLEQRDANAGDPAQALDLARRELERGNYQAARSALIGSLQQHGETRAVRELLNQTLDREARQLLLQGNWHGARAELQTLLVSAPGYAGAEALLDETYRQAAQAALERQDLAGARLELQALLARPGHQASDEALYRRLAPAATGPRPTRAP